MSQNKLLNRILELNREGFTVTFYPGTRFFGVRLTTKTPLGLRFTEWSISDAMLSDAEPDPEFLYLEAMAKARSKFE